MVSLPIVEFKSTFIKKVRDFFDNKGFLEVHTSLLSDEVIPEATIEYFEIEHKGKTLYLLPSAEINLKRLIAKGMNAVYQISSVFRKNEISPYHLQEFLMLEFYLKNSDYRLLMELMEDLILYLINTLSNELGTLSNESGNFELKKPFKRLHFNDIFKSLTQIDLTEVNVSDFNDFTKIDETYSLVVEPEIKRQSKNGAIFIIDFPWITMPFAKKKDGYFVERVELYLNGLEVANGWTEIIDHESIIEAMRLENKKRRWIGFSEVKLPEKFLSEIKEIKGDYSGMAVGLDRLFMALLNLQDINLVKMP